MPVVVVTGMFPPDKGPEIGLIGQKIQEKFPRDESLGTPLLPAVYSSNLEGIISISAFQPAEGKLAEVLARASDMMSMFHGVVGARYEIKTFMTAEEIAASAARLQE